MLQQSESALQAPPLAMQVVTPELIEPTRSLLQPITPNSATPTIV
jgi:hypothetical protein